MSDYSLGHFNFTLKKTTPREVVEAIERLFLKGEFIEISGRRMYLGSSSYHSDPTFANREFTEWTDLMRYSATFQMKWGCTELHLFAEWLAPHVVVDEWNKGFIGYKIAEQASTVTAFIVSPDGVLVYGNS